MSSHIQRVLRLASYSTSAELSLGVKSTTSRTLSPYTRSTSIALSRSIGGTRSISVCYSNRDVEFQLSEPRVPRLQPKKSEDKTTPNTLVQPMGGGPKYPSASLSTANMHRAPAAMVTKPMTNPDVEIKTPRDPNTLSNYHNYVTRHTSVDFDIDFEKKRLVGSVVLRMESLVDGDDVDVVLDSRYVHDKGAPTCLEKRQKLGTLEPKMRFASVYRIKTDVPTVSLTYRKSKLIARAQNSAVESESNPMAAP
jgi:hypothetical protein